MAAWGGVGGLILAENRRVNAKASKSGNNGSSTPLFSLDQNEFESALAADHLNVEETARKVSRSDVEALIAAISDSTSLRDTLRAVSSTFR